MTITIKYFGQLAEVTNCTEEQLSSSNGTIADLLTVIFNKYPQLKGKDFKVAQNQELVSNDTPLSGQEIALLPPFSGG